LLDDNFEQTNFFKKWIGSGSINQALVSKELSKDGINRTRCLVVRNSRDTTWVYSHNQKIEAQKGDVFTYEGLVNIRGEKSYAYLGIAAFDKQEKAVNWNLFPKRVNTIGTWTKVTREFMIADDRIQYITFRLVGVGSGVYRFDDILFRKIK